MSDKFMHNYLGVEYTIHRDKRQPPHMQWEAYRNDIGVTKGWGIRGGDFISVKSRMESVIRGYLQFNEEDQDAWKQVER